MGQVHYNYEVDNVASIVFLEHHGVHMFQWHHSSASYSKESINLLARVLIGLGVLGSLIIAAGLR